MSDEWCLIESDPGVFTELITGLGVKNTQVEELYALDDDLFQQVSPIYGLIFLFKWTPELERSDDRPVMTEEEIQATTTTGSNSNSSSLFFAKQVVTNACATQAILSILLNSEEIDVGETLANFKAFTSEFPADLKGTSIGNSDPIRVVHNSFAKNEPFVIDKDNYKGEKEDAFHFIAYVPHGGKVYELDGLKEGPICLGEYAGGGKEAWLSVAKPAIESRINRYAGNEIRFNLLALAKDRLVTLSEKIGRYEEYLTWIATGMEKVGNGEEIKDEEVLQIGGMDLEEIKAEMGGGLEGQSMEGLEELLASVTFRISEYQEEKKEEESKHSRWKEENIRRRHNFIPLAMFLLKKLAEKGKLKEAVEKGRGRLQEMRAKKKEDDK